VTDDSTGLPIPDVWVYVLNYETGEYGGGDGSTNSDGFYSYPALRKEHTGQGFNMGQQLCGGILR